MRPGDHTRNYTSLTDVTSARALLRLADQDAILAMVRKNPSIVQVAHDANRNPAALLAFLPLNEFGATAFVAGQCDPAQPDPAWITRPGEKPTAIYLWLFHGPGLNIRCLESIGEVFHATAPERCPVFSRGATDLSERLQLKLGTFRAREIHPNAPDWLLVALPPGSEQVGRRHRTSLVVRHVRTLEELSHVLSIRSATYLAEQFPRHAEEFDGNDLCSSHLVAYIDGDPAGAIRVRYFGDFAKVERLAVKLEYRRSRAAFSLCRAAFNHVRQKGFSRVYGHASDDIAPFWRHMGARHLPDRPAFRFANVDYREMVVDLAPDPLAIRFGAAPLVTIRPEGAWDEPGPLDWSNLIDDQDRVRLMDERRRKRHS